MEYLKIKLQGINEEGIEQSYKLSDFLGENLIVYFYPQDDTPVCTQEANYFKEAMNDLKKYAKIIGVSKSPLSEHIDFQQKYNLNFTLLSDTGNELKTAFSKQDKYLTTLHRTTFILNKKGEIIKYWDKVDVDGHIQEILNFFEKNKKI